MTDPVAEDENFRGHAWIMTRFWLFRLGPQVALLDCARLSRLEVFRCRFWELATEGPRPGYVRGARVYFHSPRRAAWLANVGVALGTGNVGEREALHVLPRPTCEFSEDGYEKM